MFAHDVVRRVVRAEQTAGKKRGDLDAIPPWPRIKYRCVPKGTIGEHALLVGAHLVHESLGFHPDRCLVLHRLPQHVA